MHSTHFAIEGSKRADRFKNANKLTTRVEPTPYLGRRLVAYMTGEGRDKSRTPAVCAVIAAAAAHNVLPQIKASKRSPANVAQIAVYSLLVADYLVSEGSRGLSPHHDYMIRSYTPTGRMSHSKQATMPTNSEHLSSAELKMLAEAGLMVTSGQPLSKQVVAAIIGRDVQTRFPVTADMILPYSSTKPEIDELVQQQEVRNEALRRERQPTPSVVTLSVTEAARLQERWRLREIERQKIIPRS